MTKATKRAQQRRRTHHVQPQSRQRRQHRQAKSAQHTSAAAIAMATGSRTAAVDALTLATRAGNLAMLAIIGCGIELFAILAILIWR